MNAKQLQVYKKLLEELESRKAPLLSSTQTIQQAYIRPMEVERELLDAMSVVISSGYFLE